jgi:hypothetical protein
MSPRRIRHPSSPDLSFMRIQPAGCGENTASQAVGGSRPSPADPPLQRLDPGREVGQLDRPQRDATSDTVVRARSQCRARSPRARHPAVPRSPRARPARSRAGHRRVGAARFPHGRAPRRNTHAAQLRLEAPGGGAVLCRKRSSGSGRSSAKAPIGRGSLRLPRAAEDELASVVGERVWRLVPWEHAVGNELGS